MVSFLHTGDIHLGLQFKNLKLNKESSIQRRIELWETFERMIDYSIENKLDFIFLVGDIFEDKYFTLGDIRRLRDILSKAREVNILIAAGNHDYIHRNSLYKSVEWSENVYIFGNEEIELKEFKELDTAIYGYSWDRTHIDNDNIFDNLEFNSNMKNKILLIHGDVNSNSKYLPLNLNKLREYNLDYIALGHIHKPEKFSGNIAYPGCPEPFDFGEAGDRGFIRGRIEGTTDINFIPFSKRKFIIEKLTINEELNHLEIINEFDNLSIGNKNMDYFRIELDGYIENNIQKEELFEAIKNKFYYLEIIDNTIPDYDLEYLEKTYENNLIGSFIREMKEKDLDNQINKKALYYGLEVLLKERV